MDIPQPGDRIRTFTGHLGVVLRPNRLDHESLIVWPDTWGRPPVNTTDGPGMSLHHTSLTLLTTAPAKTTPPPPNPTLAATANQAAAPRPGVQR